MIKGYEWRLGLGWRRVWGRGWDKAGVKDKVGAWLQVADVFLGIVVGGFTLKWVWSSD